MTRAIHTHMLQVRYKEEINTDPRRRCYDGCHAASKEVWTEWRDLFSSSSAASLEESKDVFEAANKKCLPKREYRIHPLEGAKT